MSVDEVDHPSHYGGKDNPYEAIKVIRAWSLGFSLGNALKYLCRAGKKWPKDPITKKASIEIVIEDLEKAKWYIQEEIDHLKKDLPIGK